MDNEIKTFEKFTDELNIRTKSLHDKSDKLVNLKLAVVLTDTTLYGKALAEFYYVFSTIEAAMAKYNGEELSEIINILLQDGISRTKEFENDIEFYLGPEWKNSSNISNPCQLYCDRILEVADTQPILLVAYVHTMYLALIAGGQIIKKIISKTLGIEGTCGLSIFEFYGISQAELKFSVKDAVDGLKLDRDMKEKIIAEKIRIFQMNNLITENIEVPLKSFSRISKLLLLILLGLFLLIYFIQKLCYIVFF